MFGDDNFLIQLIIKQTICLGELLGSVSFFEKKTLECKLELYKWFSFLSIKYWFRSPGQDRKYGNKKYNKLIFVTLVAKST